MNSKVTITILKILAVNILIIVLAVIIYAFGYEYDKAHGIYSEPVYLSYDLSISTYGQRWSRLSRFILLTAIVIDAVAILMWYRRKQIEKDSSSLFNTD